MSDSLDSSQQTVCPACGAELSKAGLCPRCLIAEAAQATEPSGSGPGHVPPSLEDVTTAFPQFEVIELIGTGGMGTVWRARQPKLNRFVALKLLPATLAERDSAFAERFEREGQLLARLHHPNIVTVHDSGRAGAFFYLLMEFVDGVNLRQAMRASRFTSQQALAIVPKICDALQYAHEEGVLHRDIKPENILLDAKGRVKLVDFGIAKLTTQVESAPAGAASGIAPVVPDQSLTVSDATLGTPNYMAPEQMAQPGEVDHRADIYSLGVVFYELLTGELPLGKFAPPSELTATDPRLDGIVRQALEKERTKRQQSVAEVRTQVETVAGTPAPLPSEAQRTSEEARFPWKLPQVIGRNGKPVVSWPVVLNMLAVQFGVQAALVLLIWLAVGRIFPLHYALALTAINALVITALGLDHARKSPAAGVPPARASMTWILAIAILVAIGTGATFYLALRTPRAAERHAPVELTAFAPVIERVLPFDGSFVDFQTGSVTRPEWNDLAAVHDLDPWLQRTGADAMVEESPSHPRSEGKGYPRLVSVARAHPIRPDERESCVFVREEKDDFDSVHPGDADIRLKAVTERDLWWGLAEGGESWWFKSRDGAKGVLQILGRADNPPGLKIRYKLLVPEIHARGRTAARPATPATPRSVAAAELTTTILEPVLGFGPVMERVVEQPAAPAYRWFDLDLGRALSAATAFPGEEDEVEDEDVRKWRIESGADVGAAMDGEHSGILSLDPGFSAVPVLENQWEQMTPAAVEEILRVARSEQQSFMRAEMRPASYVFKTREGGRGLLQILGAIEEPRGLKIRYKLVAPTASTPVPGKTAVDGRHLR